MPGLLVREVFTAGDAVGGEPVENPTLPILDALLGAPAAGKRRYGGLPRAEQIATGWHAFELPEGTTPEQACQLCEAALGRPLAWEQSTRRRGGPFAKRWIVRDLTPEEVDRVRQALEPLRQMSEAAYAERRRARRQLREESAWLSTWIAEHGYVRSERDI